MSPEGREDNMKKLARILAEEGLLLRIASVDVSALPAGIASWYRKNKDFIEGQGSLITFAASKKGWSNRYFEDKGWSDVVGPVPVMRFEVRGPRGSMGAFEITWYEKDLRTKKKPFHVAEGKKLRLHEFNDYDERAVVKALDTGIKKAVALLGKLKGKISVTPKYNEDDPQHRFKEKNQYVIFEGVKEVGEVWKGMDGWWHTSNYRAGEGFRFRKRQQAVDSFLDLKLAPSLGKRSPAWE
jgi:hypothetical protein